MGGHRSELFGGTSGELANSGASNFSQVEKLLSELDSRGARFSREDVVGVVKTDGARIIWLEKGKSGEGGSGLNHIVERHGSEFAQNGVRAQDIPNLLLSAVSHGKIVGYQGKGVGRPIFEIAYKGRTHRVAITIGKNGYIVGANHRGIVKED